MLLSIHSTVLVMFPKPGILVSTPGMLEVVRVSGSYSRATFSFQQSTMKVSISLMLSQRSYQSLDLLHHQWPVLDLLSLASI